jgi:Outer membrane protein beta-barrel domain
MQSVPFKKSSTFPRLAPRSKWTRQFPSFLSAFLMAMGMLTWAVPCRAQDTQTAPAAPEAKERFDVGVAGLYQVTNQTNGNSILEDTTESGGALISFRQPYRPWLGYEADLSYTKFYEAYNKGIVKVESNVTDISFSYLLQSPLIYGVQPYLTLGGGIIVFAPISGTLTNLNQTVPNSLPSQLLPEFTYSFGLKLPLLGLKTPFNRFGVNGGLRGLKYKTPDFHQVSIDTRKLRTTLQPNIGVYYRF